MQNARPSVGGAALVMPPAVALRAVLDDAGREAWSAGARAARHAALCAELGDDDPDEPKVIGS